MDDQFDISILDSGNSGNVIVFARCGNDRAVETLPCPSLATISQFRDRLNGAALNSGEKFLTDELEKFGTELFEFFARLKIRDMYSSISPNHMRLQLYSNRADLQLVPWEYFRAANGIFGPDRLRSVVRVVPTVGVRAEPPIKLDRAIRVLFVHAEPLDQTGVEWVDIEETIRREFKSRADAAGIAFEMDIIPGATKSALSVALGKKQYDILHFSCHGEIDKNGIGTLLLQDIRTRKKDPITGAQLGTLLRGQGLRLVVLSACEMSAGDVTKQFSILAKALVEAGIPAVVANQFRITNSAAATFSTGFYRELCKSGDVDRAITEGRVELNNQTPSGTAHTSIEWGIPSLYRLDGASKVFAL